jgi:hypothetical protein
MSNFDEGFMLDSSKLMAGYREQIDIVHRHCEERLRRSNPDLSVASGLLRSSGDALRRPVGSQ